MRVVFFLFYLSLTLQVQHGCVAITLLSREILYFFCIIFWFYSFFYDFFMAFFLVLILFHFFLLYLVFFGIFPWFCSFFMILWYFMLFFILWYFMLFFLFNVVMPLENCLKNELTFLYVSQHSNFKSTPGSNPDVHV